MAKKVSRRLQELQKKVEDRVYQPVEGLSLLKETATAKFPEALRRIFGWELTLSTQINNYEQRWLYLKEQVKLFGWQ